MIVRDKEGKFHVTTNHHAVGGGATWGMFWGLLFGVLFFIPVFGMAVGAGLGALIGKLEKTGIDKQFQDQVRDMLKPGTSALFIVVEKVTPDKAVEALEEFGGTVMKSSLSKEAEQELQDALHGEAVTAWIGSRALPAAPAAPAAARWDVCRLVRIGSACASLGWRCGPRPLRRRRSRCQSRSPGRSTPPWATEAVGARIRVIVAPARTAGAGRAFWVTLAGGYGDHHGGRDGRAAGRAHPVAVGLFLSRRRSARSTTPRCSWCSASPSRYALALGESHGATAYSTAAVGADDPRRCSSSSACAIPTGAFMSQPRPRDRGRPRARSSRCSISRPPSWRLLSRSPRPATTCTRDCPANAFLIVGHEPASSWTLSAAARDRRPCW